MFNKFLKISAALLLVLTSVVALVSCAGEEDLHIDPRPTQDKLPIAFASVAAEQAEMTRVTTPLRKDFVVYGYKHVEGGEQSVFEGYKVTYKDGSANTSEDNTHGYYYVGGAQTLKYWDFAASEYHFWGVWTDDPELAQFSGAKHNVLTIKDVKLGVGDVPSAPADQVLFSSLYDRNPVSSDVVQLRFKRPYAKLRIQFYTSEPIEGEDQTRLTNISFAPDPEATEPLVNRVYGKGSVIVTYPLTDSGCSGSATETVTVADLTLPQASLPFDVVTLTSTLGISSNTAVTAPIDDSEGFQLSDMPGSPLKAPSTRAGEQPGRKYYYYPLPMGEKNPAFIMTVCVNGDSDLKTAVVPAAYMQWKPNYCYTYIFKITEAGKKISFYDVMIDPWQFGGSMDEEFKNW